MQNPLFHSWLARWFPWLALLGVVVNATGLFGEIMEPDGALYAAIAKRMALHHDFINLYGDGGDWLDKPHFPFWVTALSFKVLGINAFAYKLPALLFWGMGAFYTCRFTQLVYGRPTAQLATLLYLYAFHLLLSNFDVRAEPYLTGLVVGSVYHFYRLGQKTDGRHLLAGALWCAGAVMTKGIFVLIIIGSGLVVHWLVLRQWWQWGRWVWYAAVALVLVFIMPELYVLYRQFDQHPEKWVFGRQGVSGIRFFFWDSQFGRFFNTGPIRGSGDPMFYLHTLLWAFLPWGLLLYAALYTSIRRSIRNRHFLPEYICLGTGLATLLLFSLSQFQLPHYLNIVFPFYAIIVAHWLGSLSPVAVRRVVWVQQGVVLLLVVGMAGLSLLYRPPGWVVSLIGLAVWAGLGLYLFRGGGWAKALGRSCWAMAALGIFLHLVFFSDLLQYQSGMQAGRWLRQNGYRREPVMMGCHSYSLEFYAPVDAVRRSWAQLGQQVAAGDTVVVLTPLDSLPLLQELGTVREWQRFAHFPVSRLDMGFVNAATRAKRLQWRVLALVNRRLEQP